MIDVSKITEGLDKALGVIQTLSPIAAMFGITAPVAAIVSSATSIGRNILEKVEQGSLVIHSQDKAKIEAVLADIQAANDRLNKAIEDS